MNNRNLEAWRSRQYGSLTGSELSKVLASYRELAGIAERAAAKFAEDPEVLIRSGVQVPFPWSNLYQHSFNTLLSMMAVLAGTGEAVIAAAKTDNPTRALLETFPDEDEVPDPENPGLLLAVCVATECSLIAISLYSQSMADLVALLDERPSKAYPALHKALAVDPTVIGIPKATSLFLRAKAEGNQYWFNAFLRSLKTGPNKKRIERVELRWLEYLLREMGAFEKCSQKEIFELVMGLGLYRHDTHEGDSFKALFELFRIWRKGDPK